MQTSGSQKEKTMQLSGIENDTNRGKRRILCIDGGGILGTFPAAFLAALEQHLNHPIVSYFRSNRRDVNWRNHRYWSCDEPFGLDLLDLYEKRGPDIFGGGYGPVGRLSLPKSAAPSAGCIGGSMTLHRCAPFSMMCSAKGLVTRKPDLSSPRGTPLPNLCISTRRRITRASETITSRSPLTPRSRPPGGTDIFSATHYRARRRALGWRHLGRQFDRSRRCRGCDAPRLVTGFPAFLSLGCLEETYAVPKSAGIGTLGTKLVKAFHGRAVPRGHGHRKAAHRART